MRYCAFSRRSALPTPASWSGSSTFSMTVFHGNIAVFWNTKPTSRSFSSGNSTSPSVGVSSPLMMFSSTDLPHWPGPSSTRNSFSRTSRLTLLTASNTLFRP